MSALEQRLSAIADRTTSLNTQMRELEQLRVQLKKAQLSARGSRPKSHGKKTQIRNDKGRILAAA
jgi:hypothetical protein